AALAALAAPRRAFLAGLVALVGGDFARARDAFAEAVEQDPKTVEARVNLALSCEKLGDLAEAEQHYLVAIDQSPETLDAAANLGALYARQGRTNDALAFLELVARADRKHLDVMLLVVKLAWELGDADRLLAWGREIGGLVGAPEARGVESVDALGQIFAHVGDVLEKKGDAIGAAAAFEMATFLRPKDGEPFRRLGLLWLAAKDFSRAIKALESAVRAAPNEPAPLEALALAYEKLGAPKAAELCRQRLATLKKTP
ncbi:MAG: hypothetical protein C4523_00170, partial [Myxococcales bacterium]